MKGGETMKKALIICLAFALCLSASIVLAADATAPAPAATPAPAMKTAAPSLDLARMEVASGVENRQPVGIASTFPATTENVFCFVEFKNVLADTQITYVWTLGMNEMARVTQQVKRSWRWRTWSSKALGGLKGDWKVDVLDASGNVLKSATFKVE
jgi:Protein of unknown function (DUF2914)